MPAVATAAPAPRQAGPALVSETFTGATADPGFLAVGTACLTGAPQGAAPGPGSHPLTGCPPGSAGAVPPDNAAPHGYLRLTGASNDESGAVLYNQAIPSQAGVDITFEQWQYGSTTPDTPADGISFFLVDGAASLEHPGAFGGSLGYAQKLPDDDPGQTFLPGVDRGYLGVGLDVLGNYFGDWEHRGNGCPAGQRSPAGTAFRVPAPGANMVTLRGPGDGTTGYCFLTATTSNFTTTGPWPSTLPGTLQGPTTSLPPGVTPEQAEALLDPSRRTVHIVLTPSPNPQLTVDIDFHDGNGFRQVVATDAPQPVPDSYKFGFAASTGLFTDVHLIRNLSVNPEQPLPALSLVKQVRQSPPLPSPLVPGTKVPYEYVVTNSGNTRLTGVNVTDDKVAPITCPATQLDPGKSTTCIGTYTVTAADAAAGHVTNVATAHGDSGGTPVDSNQDTQTLPVAVRAIGLVKSVDAARTYAPGDVVTYTYTVTNHGGTILDGVHVVDDRVSGITCQQISLAPGASTTCSGTYTVTEADAAAGHVTNVATAFADEDSVSSEPDTATIPVGRPHLHLVKSVDSSHPYAAGDVVTYTYTLTNTGATTLTGLRIDDDRVTGITCGSTTLDPGASTTCTGTYMVTEADAAAGHVTNVATAAADDGTVSEQETATITTGTPALFLVKSVDSSHAYLVGDTVTYTYTVTNTGSAPVDELHIVDDRVANITCQAGTLAPGASTTCTGTYTVTAADAAAGQITNNATAKANDDTVVSPPATATVDVETSALHLIKHVDGSRTYAVGDVVTYTYTVTNTGTTPVTGLRINDDRVTGVTCEATGLAPGASTTCTGTYTVTEADARAGKVTNTATALGNGDSLVSEPADATITVCPPPKPPCPPPPCPPKDCPSKPDHPSKPDCPPDDGHQGW
ncbi:DUF7507 domain-containing protein [Uniformispora flossi]|uniref:DUF7507 domain-containing protein n=1 Tax=Uniformispora flossi TaxID=3390723 RepID=UPI003C2F5DD6